jgi:hypothetical protein
MGEIKFIRIFILSLFCQKLLVFGQQKTLKLKV